MLLSFDIPDARQPRIEWLESQITDVNLGGLVAEFRAVHQVPRSAEQPLQKLIGDQTTAVMEKGLSALTDAQIQSLLRNPGSLFELQEELLLSGSKHWQQIGQASDIDLSFDPNMLTSASLATNDSTPAPATTSAHTSAQKSNWYSHPALVSLVTAACVLIATNLFQRSQTTGEERAETIAPSVEQPPVVAAAPSKGWGWDGPGALQDDLEPDAYLNSLADAAGDWFKKRPESPRDVAKRIAQFRQGCSTLILADHQALAESDRTWLTEKCRLWAGKLDQHLAAIEAGDTTLDVRDAADETINKLINAIKSRAKELSA